MLSFLSKMEEKAQRGELENDISTGLHRKEYKTCPCEIILTLTPINRNVDWKHILSSVLHLLKNIVLFPKLFHSLSSTSRIPIKLVTQVCIMLAIYLLYCAFLNSIQVRSYKLPYNRRNVIFVLFVQC